MYDIKKRLNPENINLSNPKKIKLDYLNFINSVRYLFDKPRVRVDIATLTERLEGEQINFDDISFSEIYENMIYRHRNPLYFDSSSVITTTNLGQYGSYNSVEHIIPQRVQLKLMLENNIHDKILYNFGLWLEYMKIMSISIKISSKLNHNDDYRKLAYEDPLNWHYRLSDVYGIDKVRYHKDEYNIIELGNQWLEVLSDYLEKIGISELKYKPYDQEITILYL